MDRLTDWLVGAAVGIFAGGILVGLLFAIPGCIMAGAM